MFMSLWHLSLLRLGRYYSFIFLSRQIMFLWISVVGIFFSPLLLSLILSCYSFSFLDPCSLLLYAGWIGLWVRVSCLFQLRIPTNSTLYFSPSPCHFRLLHFNSAIFCLLVRVYPGLKETIDTYNHTAPFRYQIYILVAPCPLWTHRIPLAGNRCP